ncbi:hypothetical protein [Massilia sp. Dwa41.01b]|uniref:hypothetical protein n=1 Tax=Massilia sp. Dwa41.01b TaxID=2709302 RepID=UPI001E475A17|nr:hypothetical protein [Massilia sp. Dwa41.01b]
MRAMHGAPPFVFVDEAGQGQHRGRYVVDRQCPQVVGIDFVEARVAGVPEQRIGAGRQFEQRQCRAGTRSGQRRELPLQLAVQGVEVGGQGRDVAAGREA